MKSLINLKIYYLLALLILFSFVFTSRAFAQTKQNPITTLDSSQTINGDYFAANSTVNLEGTVNGDAYLAGGDVNVDGTINGDLLAAGGNINIKGKVTGNVRSAGGQITISGNVGKNVSLAGGNLSLLDGAKVEGNLAAAGGNMSLSSTIGGSVNSAVSQLNIAKGSNVSKDLTYWSNNSAIISKDASVSGKITQYASPKFNFGRAGATGFLGGVFSFYRVVSLVSSLIVGFLLIRFLPLYAQETAGIIFKKPWQSFLVGLASIVAFPVLILALVITVFGFPLAILLGATFFILLYFSKIFVGLVIGQKLLDFGGQKLNPYLTFIVGLIILGFLSYVPFLGGAVIFILGLMGLGAILIEKKQIYTSLKDKKII